jgi:hypothetical protein
LKVALQEAETFTFLLRQERFLALPADKQRTEFQAEQLGSSEGEDSPSLPKVLLQLSPFTVVQASMGWDTFHMVHKTWLDAINTPPSSHEKDWDMQVEMLSRPLPIVRL